MQALRFAFITTLLLLATGVFAQKFPAVDKSPADIAYGRLDNEVVARVIYGRPMKNGREVFGKLVPYGKIWRAGANEATEVQFFRDVKVAGKDIKAGTYTLYLLPNENAWTLILNSDLHQWGAYRYQEENDVLRVEVPTQETKDLVEAFAITFDKAGNGLHLLIGWDRTFIEVPVE
ncbi:MAG: hypothetical protein OHK0039_25090 [Bacteroidia bacterium]